MGVCTAAHVAQRWLWDIDGRDMLFLASHATQRKLRAYVAVRIIPVLGTVLCLCGWQMDLWADRNYRPVVLGIVRCYW